MHGRLIRLFVPIYLLTVSLVGMAWAREATTRAGAEETVRASEGHHRVLDVLHATGDQPGDLDRWPGDLGDLGNLGDLGDLGDHLVIVDGTVLDGEGPGDEGAGDGPGRSLSDQDDRRPLPTRALAPGAAIWPWTDAEGIVTTSSATIGGRSVQVATWTSIDGARRAVTRRLVVGAGLALTAAALLAAAVHPLAVGATRPLRRLGQAAEALADGVVRARADEHRGPDAITEVAASVNRMADRMDEAVERERTFVASASHHFGNLLTPLRLRVETLLAESHPSTRCHIEEVIGELDRLEAVAEQLMQLNRAENDETTPAPIDLAGLVDEAVRSWQPVADFAGVTLVHDRPDQVEAIGLSWAVTEILDNLIDNALKYGRGSPISVRVLMGLDNVRVSVIDGGPGMPIDQLDLAPVRFWRGPSHQNQPGNGLGLAIVATLATRCGARFSMRNRPDGGLEASVALRRSPRRDAQTRSATEIGAKVSR